MTPPSELPPPLPPPSDVRDAAREILSRPEFKQPPKSLYDRVVDWLGELLDRTLRTLFGGGQGTLIGWALLVAVLALLGYLLWRFVRNSDVWVAGREPGVTVSTDVRRTATDWEKEAIERERAGDWRNALRCRYRALVARLGASGAFEEIPGRTAGEYKADLRRTTPGASPPFDEASDLFERVWYGRRETGRDDTVRIQTLSERVLEEATHR